MTVTGINNHKSIYSPIRSFQFTRFNQSKRGKQTGHMAASRSKVRQEMPCVWEQKSHDVIRLIRSGVKHGYTIRNRPIRGEPGLGSPRPQAQGSEVNPTSPNIRKLPPTNQLHTKWWCHPKRDRPQPIGSNFVSLKLEVKTSLWRLKSKETRVSISASSHEIYFKK